MSVKGDGRLIRKNHGARAQARRQGALERRKRDLELWENEGEHPTVPAWVPDPHFVQNKIMRANNDIINTAARLEGRAS